MASKNKFQDSVENLEESIRHHNYLYFVKNSPEISDYAFDKLVEELKKKKPDSSVLKEIVSDLSSGHTIRHQVPMLSLDKCYEEETLLKWGEKFLGEVLASPKIDGVAMALRYNNRGELYLAATRGDGVEGEVVTPNIRFVRAIPQKINLQNVEVRGEVYMPLSIFEKYQEKFANPRNLTAGAIKQKDPKKTGEYQLSFFAYDLLGGDLKTEEEKQKRLQKEGFPVVDWKIIDKESMQSVFNAFFSVRTQRDYETDGVVFKANAVAEQNRLGGTAHHPRYAIAYKFQGECGESVVEEIFWSVSRTGTITPVAKIAPVVLSGAKVTRVSLHNVGLAKKLGAGVGASVLVMRRGGVIPNIESVVKKGKSLTLPKKCPSCRAATKQIDDFLYCSNPKKCQVSRISELEHYAKVVGIDGFGEKLLTKIYELGLLKDASDFYRLTVEELIPLERMGEVLAKKLVANVQAQKEISLDVFLRALGIHELGKHVSKILATKYISLENICQVSKEELASIHSVGEKIAESVLEGLNEKKTLIDRLFKMGVVLKKVHKKSSGALQGKTFLFTGTLSSMPRSEAESLVEAKGGMIASSVSQNLNYLVVGGAGGAGSKWVKAQKLQVKGSPLKILSETEFIKIVTN